MVAIDTNIVVRLIVRDDEAQSQRARRLLEREQVLLLTTVILESEWVLRSIYRHTKTEIIGAFRSLFGLPGVSLEQPDRVKAALELAESGCELSDAMHVAGLGDAVFATFDLDLIRRAKRSGVAMATP